MVARPPQHQQRARYLDTGGAVGPVMLQVDGGGGAVILAHGMDRGRVPEAPDIFRHGFPREMPGAHPHLSIWRRR